MNKALKYATAAFAVLAISSVFASERSGSILQAGFAVHAEAASDSNQCAKKTKVKSYTKKDGTRVKAHSRKSPSRKRR